MVPAGEPTEIRSRAAGLLASAMSWWTAATFAGGDSVRRAGELAARGIGFVDAGTSGGVWGRNEGYCLMVGGDDEHVALGSSRCSTRWCRPRAGSPTPARPATGTSPRWSAAASSTQAYAEGYELLVRSDLGIDAEGVMAAWRHGSVVRSWLLDLLVRALGESPGLDGIAGVAHDSGEGRWTVQEAIERISVATPVISAALFAVRVAARRLRTRRRSPRCATSSAATPS